LSEYEGENSHAKLTGSTSDYNQYSTYIINTLAYDYSFMYCIDYVADE